MGNGKFWTGVALGALTVGTVALASSQNRYCRGYYGNSFLGGYTGFNNFGYNNFGYNYGFNSFSPFGFGYYTPSYYAIGETPYESIGFSNHTLAQMPLGSFLA